MRLNEISENLIEKHKNDISTSLYSDVKLYRGIGNMLNVPIGTQTMQTIRRDRQLLNSSRISGFVFDTVMKLKKWPFRKSNTASITITPEQTGIYGGTCRVYPFNGTWYLYSTTSGDFMIPIDTLVRIIYKQLGPRLNLPRSFTFANRDLLMANLDQIEEWLANNMNIVDQVVDFHVTTDVDELKYAVGEILMWGSKQFIAVRLPYNRGS